MTIENGAGNVADDQTPTAPQTTNRRIPDSASLQDQLRAVTKERSRLSARVSELEPLQAEIAKLRSTLGEQQTRYAQDMHLVELGISSSRARRSIRREWRDEVAEQEEQTPFEDFVGSLKQDDFYGALFAQQKEAQAATPQAAPKAPAPAADPNAGAAQPTGSARPLDAQQYNSIKSRAQRLALAKKHGLID